MPLDCSSERWTTRQTLTWKEVKALHQLLGDARKCPLSWEWFLPVWLPPHLGGFPLSSSPGAAHEPVPAVRQQHRGARGVRGGGQDLHRALPSLPGPAHPPAAPAAPRRSREYSSWHLGFPWGSAAGAGRSSVSSHKAVGIARGLGRSCSLLQLLLSS